MLIPGIEKRGSQEQPKKETKMKKRKRGRGMAKQSVDAFFTRTSWLRNGTRGYRENSINQVRARLRDGYRHGFTP